MKIRDIDPVVIESVMDATIRSKYDRDMRGLVATINLKVATDSLSIGRLNAMLEANVPIQVIISTRQTSFPMPSDDLATVREDDILGP